MSYILQDAEYEVIFIPYWITEKIRNANKEIKDVFNKDVFEKFFTPLEIGEIMICNTIIYPLIYNRGSLNINLPSNLNSFINKYANVNNKELYKKLSNDSFNTVMDRLFSFQDESVTEQEMVLIDNGDMRLIKSDHVEKFKHDLTRVITIQYGFIDLTNIKNKYKKTISNNIGYLGDPILNSSKDNENILNKLFVLIRSILKNIHSFDGYSAAVTCDLAKSYVRIIF